MLEYDLILFDIDGTIADRDTNELLPGVYWWFSQHAHACSLAFITNQGGVGLRNWMEAGGFGEPDKFPTEEQVLDHIHKVLSSLPNGPYKHYVCYAYQSKKSGKWSPIPEGKEEDSKWSPVFRKPNPGMLMAAIVDFDAERTRTLFVGNSEEDEEAALQAGVAYQSAEEFFRRGSDLTTS